MKKAPILALTLLNAFAALLVFKTVTPAAAGDDVRLFITSAVEQANNRVILPLHRGTSNGQAVYYIITDTSDENLSDKLGVNRSNKLENAANTQAVQKVSYNADGTIEFPATVDFSPVRRVTPGPQGFPPIVAEPGAIGETGYSPLIQLPNGTIVNAPHIANASGQADKVESIDTEKLRVTYLETDGFAYREPVKYISTEASDPVAATLENATYAPALNNVPIVGDDSTASARSGLVAFTNGQISATNPQRQGLNSALLDGLDPLNILSWNPNQSRYSPLWDVYLAQWSQDAISTGQNVRQTDFFEVKNYLAERGLVTSFGGGAFAPTGFIVNCPTVSSRRVERMYEK